MFRRLLPLRRCLSTSSSSNATPTLYSSGTTPVSILSWGRGASGQLGGGKEERRLYPSPVANLSLPDAAPVLSPTPGRLPDAAETAGGVEVGISCGLFHSAVLVGGDAWVWGKGDGGRLGLGDESSAFVPRHNPNLRELRVLALGGIHSAALTASGDVFTWGYGGFGALGHYVYHRELLPRQVNGPWEGKISHIATSGAHTAAITDSGELYTWGRDEGDGRLGLGSGGGPGEAGSLSVPSKVNALPVPVAAVACGGFFTMALTSDGQLWSWGGTIMAERELIDKDKLVLRGLQFHGFHGVKQEEKTLGQKFVVDVDAWMDLSVAGETDSISDTVSYTDIYRIAKDVVEGPSRNLLEAVAHRIASATLLKFPQISAIRVKVGKPHVAVQGIVDYLGVEILRAGVFTGAFSWPETAMLPAKGDRAGPSSGKDGSEAAMKKRNKPKYHPFTQQELPACKPILIPQTVILVLVFVGLIFIPVGLACIAASNKVVELVDRYDTKCVPRNMLHNKVAYIQNSSIDKTCTRSFKIPKDMKKPIYIYYQLDKFYQNHRRYVKSLNDMQLRYPKKVNDTRYCSPEATANGRPIVPCGLIAWSLFNDTYSFTRVRGSETLRVNKHGISWKSERDHRFGKHVYPNNFQNGTLIGGGQLNPSIPLSEQEDLIVWMRIAALPTFRKLYGKIDMDLQAGDLVQVTMQNNYNSYSFDGKKSLVLSTAGWLGGKSAFLGRAYVVVGLACFLLAMLLTLICVAFPMKEEHLSLHYPPALLVR
ncbi:hypothetical protein E2562_008844 [Oryza meyeriana var. granulata]|uniref:7,8-dihydroneopterin aldolase n=1 Tax=Oryza meyeriana var. granulata TaxID=110450 RepID=A0A6G1D0A6_9ORYZ|nr:hypothetical protein E2562_008844 [Oryza meyeriana var. granulata]